MAGFACLSGFFQYRTTMEIDMNLPSLLQSLAVLCTALSLGVCIAAPTPGQAWTANGASACEKYLTPDVLAAVLVTPSGTAQPMDANSCHTGIIYVSLNTENVSSFRLKLSMITGVHLMSGVGDAAYWNEAGAVSAAKGKDRGCDIAIVGAPGQFKLHHAELGEKLGEICNKLFALP
jgi:hypothetical protein